MPAADISEEDIKNIADELVSFHELFHGCYRNTKTVEKGLIYLSGLLSNSSAKSIEPIALKFLGTGEVRNLQRFMKTHVWDQEKMEQINMSEVAKLISSPTGMITIDPSDFQKKGKESVGVARQYCGSLGKIDNCQSGVFGYR